MIRSPDEWEVAAINALAQHEAIHGPLDDDAHRLAFKLGFACGAQEGLAMCRKIFDEVTG